MSLADYKFKEADFQERKIADLSDTPSSDGMSAAQLKAYFDYIPKTMIAMNAINGIIDLLLSTEGAANIGVNVEGMEGANVKEILREITETLDKIPDTYVEDFEIDEETGKIKVTYSGEIVTEYDLGLKEITELAEELKQIAGGDIASKQFVQETLEGYASKEYVAENGGKIDVIKVNGVEQTITDKAVDIEIESDSALSESSTNSVQNAVVTAELNKKAPAYTYGTEDVTAGSASTEPEGSLHFVIE